MVGKLMEKTDYDSQTILKQYKVCTMNYYFVNMLCLGCYSD